MRTRGMLAFVGALIVAASLTMTPSAHAVSVPATPQEQSMSPASEASAASTAARALRRDVAALLQQYIDGYGNRFSSAEITKLKGYKSNADQQLAGVVLTTNRLRYLTSNGATPTQVRSAARRAATTWSRAKSAADTSWEDARRIMEPKLSLFEKLSAANDYNAMMDRFDTLGAQINAVTTTQRAR